MSDLKNSLLVNSQVPEFVREEHPRFIAFLEAYYEFLENKQNSELNDLNQEAKKLRYISDVDESLDEFEQNFFNTYLSLIPRDVEANKEFLIKNILPVYLSKGSESSFKLLFRLLFGQDVAVSFPKDKILRASDGKWTVENILRVLPTVSSLQRGDGQTVEFSLVQLVDPSEIDVYIDDVLLTSGFYVKRESKKIVFDTAPADNSEIVISYNNFDINLLKNRKVVGNTSSATAIVESVVRASISGGNYLEVFINRKTLTGGFIIAENILSDVILDNGETVQLRLQTVSELASITVIKGGRGYNVGDPVLVSTQADEPAYAIIEDVEKGTIENIDVLNGGAGFKVDNIVYLQGVPNTTFDVVVSSVDASGNLSANSVIVYTDIISQFANTTLNVASYGFPNSLIASANINTVVSNALSNTIISALGPISTINVRTSLIATELQNPVFEVTPATVNGAITLLDLGIIGKINIINGGQNYVVGDEIIFTNQPGEFWGRGAEAKVSEVSGNGSIQKITITNGGLGYSPLSFPTVTANTANGGSNSSLQIYCIMGDGESLQGLLPRDKDGNLVYPGQIKTIKVLDPGSGYKIIPTVDLTKSGDGNAEAVAQLLESYQTLEGRWVTSDSIISSEDRRLQGRDYYINYSYVLSSKVEFSKYKEIFKQLIHPSGMIEYSEYRIDELIVSTPIDAKSVSIQNTISGLVKVNSSIYVTGTNTKFITANTRGILVPGSNIAINSQVRTVNTIISDTTLTVTAPFTITTNNESLVILT